MREDRGFVLVVSLVVMAVVAILVFGTAFTSLVDRQISGNQRGANASYYVAQAGLNQYKTLIFRNLADYYTDTGDDWCASPVGSGILDEDGDVILANGGTTAPQAFGPGTYQVSFDVSDGNENFMVLTSIGRVGRSQTTLQLVATAGGGPAGSWDNAILASGTTPGAKAINGNVSVYGSVHIVSGDLAIDNSAFDVSGTAGVYNNYAGEGSGSNDVRSELLAATGTSSTDLCARVKVKSGSIYLESGSNVLGAPGVGNELFSLHLGNGKVYDGKPGNNNIEEITDHADPDSDPNNLVNLRNPVSGMNSGYEGFDIAYPLLKAGFPGDRDSFTITAASCPWLVDGDTVAFPPAEPGSCSNEHGSIGWSSEGELVISGTVNTGALNLSVSESIEYGGKGVLRVGTTEATLDEHGEPVMAATPSVELTGEIVPADGNYPATSALAIETTGDVTLSATGKNSPMALMLYSAGNVTFEKQPLMIGGVVANTFDLGNNVPKIAYHNGVRDVAEELCLIGSFCHQGVVPPNPGVLTDISIERRDASVVED